MDSKKWYGLLQDGDLVAVRSFRNPPTLRQMYAFGVDVALDSTHAYEIVEVEVTITSEWIVKRGQNVYTEVNNGQ